MSGHAVGAALPRARWDFRRGVGSIRLMVELAAELGADARALLDGLPVSQAQLDDPKAEVDAEVELAVIERIVAALGHVPGLGLMAGSRYRLTTYGIWGYALVSSPDLRSAAQLALRYLNLTFAFTHITLEEKQGLGALTLDDADVPAHVRQFVVERDAMAIVMISRDLLQTQANGLLSLSFQWPEPPHADLYAQHLGIRPGFGAPSHVGVLPSAMLDLPLPQANRLTAQMCEQMCRDLLDQRRHASGATARVRLRLLQTPGRLPTMDQIAQEWGITSRTLRRHLIQEGVTFRELLDEVRVFLACGLIETANLGPRDIAERLGFNDTSAFIQAFRRWKGMTPSQFRRLQGLPSRSGR